VGPYGIMTLAMAWTAAQKIMLARLDGQDPAAEKRSKRKRPAGLSVGEIVLQYKAEYLEPREVDTETSRILERIVLAQRNGRQITEITRTDVRECIDAIIRRGVIAMAGRAFKVIRALSNWCVGRGLLETSPCAGLAPPPKPPAQRLTT
jgi:hypothetical protein